MLNQMMMIKVSRKMAMNMLTLQNIAIDKCGINLSQNDLCKIAIGELIIQINEDEHLLKKMIEDYREIGEIE